MRFNQNDLSLCALQNITASYLRWIRYNLTLLSFLPLSKALLFVSVSLSFPPSQIKSPKNLYNTMHVKCCLITRLSKLFFLPDSGGKQQYVVFPHFLKRVTLEKCSKPFFWHKTLTWVTLMLFVSHMKSKNFKCGMQNSVVEIPSVMLHRNAVSFSLMFSVDVL